MFRLYFCLDFMQDYANKNYVEKVERENRVCRITQQAVSDLQVKVPSSSCTEQHGGFSLLQLQGLPQAPQTVARGVPDCVQMHQMQMSKCTKCSDKIENNGINLHVCFTCPDTHICRWTKPILQQTYGCPNKGDGCWLPGEERAGKDWMSFFHCRTRRLVVNSWMSVKDSYGRTQTPCLCHRVPDALLYV